jgi:glycogen phosphorylase
VCPPRREFYAGDEHGIPRGWIARVRESMARLTPAFSANRVVRQYTEEHYFSAAAAFRQRSANRGSIGADLVAWQAELEKHWSALRFGSATIERQGDRYLFHVHVFLEDIDPDAVKVELYAEAQNNGASTTHAMNRGEQVAGETSAFIYRASILASRPAADYTPRLVPQHPGAFVPLEAPFILWHEAPSWR